MNTKQATGTNSQLMKQYTSIKEKYPTAIVLFRVGDYYEIISKDAVTAAGILGITLTELTEYEMTGFAHESLDQYLRKIINTGYTVAIVDHF